MKGGSFIFKLMRDRYIQMRNNRVVDIQLIYEYAVSKGFSLDFQSFHLGAQYLLLQNVLDQLDVEFELTLLCDINGNFIKIVT